MLFAIFGLGFWGNAFVFLLILSYAFTYVAKKAVSSPTAQKAAGSILLKVLKR